MEEKEIERLLNAESVPKRTMGRVLGLFLQVSRPIFETGAQYCTVPKIDMAS